MKKRTKRSVVEATKGSLKPEGNDRPVSAEELREAAEIAIAEDVMRRAGEPWQGEVTRKHQ